MAEDGSGNDLGPFSEVSAGAGGSLTCAVGDVHGHIDKLLSLLNRCESYSRGQALRFVFIGDYVDRGPDSRAVVEFLIDLQRRRPQQVICLRGNHEAVAVAAARSTFNLLPGAVDLDRWLSDVGGGRQTLASYGVAHASDLPAEHLEWMASLPASHDDGQRFFAHAGVHPERAIAQQKEDDLLWIREPFLSHTGPYGRLVVHGHTPTPSRGAELHANRLNLDSGAGYDGPLTAAIFDDHSSVPLALFTENGEVPVGTSIHRGLLP